MTDQRHPSMQEGQRQPDAIVQRIAHIMTFIKVGDPNALDTDGSPRWHWYIEQAEQYLRIYPWARAALAKAGKP